MSDRPAKPVPLAAQIRCLERELRLRERVYPRWILAGRLKQQVADAELAAMAAALATLRGLAAQQTTLF